MGFFSPRLGNELAASSSSNGRLRNNGGNYTVINGMSQRDIQKAQKAKKQREAKAKEKKDRSARRQAEQLAKKRARS